MTVAGRLGCLGLAVLLLPLAAAAQDATVEFRLVGAPGNITSCIAADPQFTRVHTFTLKNGQAELTAPGGINTKMKLEKPGVYTAEYELGRRQVHVVADLTAKSLTVTDKNLGCKWTAKKE